MKIITFSGVDGSGKSTQLALLKKKLEAEGKKVAYFHAVEFSLGNKIARLLKGTPTFEPGKEKAVTDATFISVMLRAKFLLIDMVRFCLLRSRLQRQGYDYLLSDRSFFDSIINLAYLARNVHFFSWLLRWEIDWLAQYTPKADIRFYFDISPEAIMSRERAPEQGIDYLRTKTALFKERVTLWNMVIIDAEKDQESVFQDISKALDV